MGKLDPATLFLGSVDLTHPKCNFRSYRKFWFQI